MTDSIWAGEIGPVFFYCPFCQAYFPESALAEYDEHMATHKEPIP